MKFLTRFLNWVDHLVNSETFLNTSDTVSGPTPPPQFKPPRAKRRSLEEILADNEAAYGQLMMLNVAGKTPHEQASINARATRLAAECDKLRARISARGEKSTSTENSGAAPAPAVQ